MHEVWREEVEKRGGVFEDETNSSTRKWRLEVVSRTTWDGKDDSSKELGENNEPVKRGEARKAGRGPQEVLMSAENRPTAWEGKMFGIAAEDSMQALFTFSQFTQRLYDICIGSP